MTELVQQLLIHQFEAALRTLAHCLAGCPEALWNASVARYPFCQTAYHTLFFADYYLELDPETFRDQAFHQANRDLFGDYEQLETREPIEVYSRVQIGTYLEFVRQKVAATIGGETEAVLSAPSRFPRKTFSRAELHVYNLRHIQHHAAQLILRLRLDSEIDVPWVRSGWD